MGNLTTEEAQNIRNALPGASDAEIAEVLTKWDAAVMGPPSADVVDYPDPAAEYIMKMAHALAAFWTVRTGRLEATIAELTTKNANQMRTIQGYQEQVKALEAEATGWKQMAATQSTKINNARKALEG